MIGFGMGLEICQEQRHSIKQKLEKKLSLRLALLHALHGEKYVPTGICPGCNRKLKPVEIMKGFNRNPDDFTTKCPRCKLRFAPKLVHKSISGTAECLFYCAVQTLARLPGKEFFSPEDLNRQYHALYRSALVHFGTMREAFKRVGIRYRFKEASPINAKVKRLLGQLPDAVIARYAGVPVSRIRALRRERGINRWRAD